MSSRSLGLTTSPGVTERPSPWSFQTLSIAEPMSLSPRAWTSRIVARLPARGPAADGDAHERQQEAAERACHDDLGVGPAAGGRRHDLPRRLGCGRGSADEVRVERAQELLGGAPRGGGHEALADAGQRAGDVRVRLIVEPRTTLAVA